MKLTRRDFGILLTGISAGLIGTAAEIILEDKRPAPPSPRVKSVRDSVTSFPNGYFITGNGALVIQWGVADENGNAKLPYVFPHTIVGAQASRGNDGVPLVAMSNSSIKTAPGAQWVVYGY